MATSTIKFACTSLAGTNKVGDLKKDENGYYTMIVGALNMHNSGGAYYEYERAKSIFSESSQLMRRVQRGALRGEYGHPKAVPGMSSDDYSRRILAIYEENICCQFKELWLDFEGYKDDEGRPIIAILAKVIPSGPHGPILERSLSNPGENVCFSIRSFTDDFYEHGKTVKIIRTVVTFDYVNEPGMSVAQKWKSPALESLVDHSFSRAEITRGMNDRTTVGMGQESVQLSAEELFTTMGWDKSVLSAPQWASWTA